MIEFEIFARRRRHRTGTGRRGSRPRAQPRPESTGAASADHGGQECKEPRRETTGGSRRRCRPSRPRTGWWTPLGGPVEEIATWRQWHRISLAVGHSAWTRCLGRGSRGLRRAIADGGAAAASDGLPQAASSQGDEEATFSAREPPPPPLPRQRAAGAPPHGWRCRSRPVARLPPRRRGRSGMAGRPRALLETSRERAQVGRLLECRPRVPRAARAPEPARAGACKALELARANRRCRRGGHRLAMLRSTRSPAVRSSVGLEQLTKYVSLADDRGPRRDRLTGLGILPPRRRMGRSKDSAGPSSRTTYCAHGAPTWRPRNLQASTAPPPAGPSARHDSDAAEKNCGAPSTARVNPSGARRPCRMRLRRLRLRRGKRMTRRGPVREGAPAAAGNDRRRGTRSHLGQRRDSRPRRRGARSPQPSRRKRPRSVPSARAARPRACRQRRSRAYQELRR